MEFIADVGGTNTRCALVNADGSPHDIEVYANSDFPSLTAALTGYLASRNANPRDAAVAVAAPITGDSVRLTNRQWHFSIEELRQDLGLDRLDVINDFSAVALSLPHLQSSDYVQVGDAQGLRGHALAVLGPGTGLGVSGLIPGPGGYATLAGEGGHATLATATPREMQVKAAITTQFGHCSAERVISGPGLVLLYNTLRELAGATAADLEPHDVTQRADDGEPFAIETLDVFFGLLGSFAGNVALTLGATGGVYIAGGVAAILIEKLQDSVFRERFEAKGRYRGYLKAIPTRVITHPTPALIGLAAVV
ncbi:MAG: glucokinase [Gammaproteobacteria bacterium]|nr:glucokinase [Gammaproteobacteria bacterium]